MTSDSPASESNGGRHARWLTLAAIVVILLPPLYAALLVGDNAVNVPHYDDFTFADDWVKFRKGDLTWSDLFSVHLEHRVTLPRLMAIGLHIIGGPDLRWQNGMTLLLLGGTLWNLAALWGRTMSGTLRSAWIPLFLISAMLFSPVQWQALLWPILFEIFVGVFSFTLLLRLWHSRLNPWLVMALSVLLCAAATLSFGNGPVTWLLTPFAIWFQRPESSVNERRKLILAWTGITVVAFALHFTNYHNSAPAAFSFESTEQSSPFDTIKKFVFDPELSLKGKIVKAVDCTWGLIGSHLVRGTSAHLLYTAQRAGCVIFFAFIAALLWLFSRRKDHDLLKRAMPWVLVGLYSLGSCTLVMLGRVSKTRSGDAAVTQRYVSHGVLLAVSLVALAWLFGKTYRQRLAWLPFAGTLMAGALLAVEAVQWNYGGQRMGMWQDARLQGKALLMFSRKGLMPGNDYLGSVSGDGSLGAGIMQDLDVLGDLPFPLLSRLVLDEQFRINKSPLLAKLGAFTGLRETAQGGLQADGYSELPSHRPADLIIFTTPDEKGVEQIFALTPLLRQPLFLYHNMQREHEWLSQGNIGPELTCKWVVNISVIKKPPQGAPTTAWAMDVSEVKPRVYRVKDTRNSSEPPTDLPAKKTPENQDNP